MDFHPLWYSSELGDRPVSKKVGSLLPQRNSQTTYKEATTIITHSLGIKWKQDHQHYKPNDQIFSLDRQGQTKIFHLRTGHTRLKHHMFHTYKIGQDDLCQFLHPQTPNHILQHRVQLYKLQEEVWPQTQPLNIKNKLYGSIAQLEATTHFILNSGFNV